MKLKLNQKGFSMMELLIALTVLALTAVPVYSMMVVAAQYVGENDMRADCLRMAENEMEKLKADFTLNPETSELYTFEIVTESETTRPPESVPGESESAVPETTGPATTETESPKYEPFKTHVEVRKLGSTSGEEGCYAVSVTVSKGDYSVTVKGVCVYEAS